VNEDPRPADQSVAEAEGKLARLGVQVEAMQALLVRLLQDVVRAEDRLDAGQAAQLLEVNEQLVLAALTSQADAEAAAQALEQAAQYTVLDALTRLPNRSALRDRFAQAVADAKRHGTRVAVLFLDLDDFKQINDARGHAFGDRVLRRVADHLVSVVREVDTVCRYGGDEFVVLLAELSQPADAQTVAEKLIAVIGGPAEAEGYAVSLTASVGVAIYPDDGEDVDTLVARADAAMYQTKRLSAGGVAFHGMAPVERVVPVLRAQGAAVRPPAPQTVGEAADPQRRLADLREANEKLILAALSAQELQAAAELAQQRQTALMAAVAEALRNPMAPIRIATAMLDRVPADELLPRVQHIVEQQTTQMSRLLGHLVDAARLDTGGLEPQRRPVDMAHVIDAAVAAYLPTMDERRQRFESYRPPSPPYVQGDAAHLDQIVSNLLDNATKYTQNGGWISLSVVTSADSLTLTVSDNGVGITPQLLPYVCEPFVQDTRALGLHGVGLGIGLTVVRALVRAHGGNLVAHSAGAGCGSQFVVTLPRVVDAPVAAGAGTAAGDAGAVG
jgi:diguanylate cyclase